MKTIRLVLIENSRPSAALLSYGLHHQHNLQLLKNAGGLPDRVVSQKIFWSSMTKRERKLIDMISYGKSNGEIARRLHLPLPIVNSQVRIILYKLGMRTRVEVAKYARMRRLIQDLANSVSLLDA
jgi:DNA-binding CsgD family transcriptional regulator